MKRAVKQFLGIECEKCFCLFGRLNVLQEEENSPVKPSYVLSWEPAVESDMEKCPQNFREPC